MFPRLRRIAISAAAVLSAYFVYAVAAVPLIEPRVETPLEDDDASTNARQNDRRDEPSRRSLAPFFPPNSWELTAKPKVLESERAKLIVKDYRNLPDGRVELRPCSMVFLPKLDDDGKPRGQAIVMQAPEGAILEFDEPFDLRRIKIGKLIGGTLAGEITIYSKSLDTNSDGRDAPDEFRFVTRDVELVEQRVYTPHDVRFRFGRNRGSGRELEIKLLAGGDGGGKSPGKIGGIQSFELSRDVQLELEADHGIMGASGAEQSHRRDGEVTPVRVTCQGPLTFDVSGLVATFNDQVDVVSLNGEGVGDQLACDELSIYFESRATDRDERGKPVDRSSAGSLGAIAPRSLEARGDPVVVEVPSAAARARCQRLRYDIATGRIVLAGSDELVLQDGENEIRARNRLEYEPAKTGGLGEFLAAGPGTVHGALRDDAANKYVVSWTRECRMFPHEQNHVISLLGTARVDLTQMGLIAADEIHLWLLDNNLGSAASVDRPSANPLAGHPQTRPDRMLAQGAVELKSPQIEGAMNRLEVWFRPEEPIDAADNAFGAAAGATALTKSIRSQPASPSLSGDRQTAYRLDGDLTRVQLTLRGQSVSGVADISIDGGASLRELPARDEDRETPLSVRGDRIQVNDADSPNTKIQVSGKPATIEARGLSLAGGKIQLDRLDNRLWIDGPGSMTLPLSRDIGGQPLAQETMLTVRWAGGMDFDGKKATFERQVVALSDQQRVSTEQLEATLRQAIDFGGLGDQRLKSSQPEILEIACAGGVTIENQSFSPDQLPVSRDRMRLRDLIVNQQTGAVHGTGPGELTSVRRGGGPTGLAIAGSPLANEANRATADPNQLQFLRVQFARGVDGNILPKRREVTLFDRVRCVYGPVADWEQQLDLDDPDSLGPDAVTIDSDQLAVRALPSVVRRGRDSVELEASGNARADGQSFSAQAHRMTYAEEKEMLVLEAGGRGYAQLIQQTQPGQPQSNLRAKRISYWVRTKQANVEGAESFDFNNLGGFGKK